MQVQWKYYQAEGFGMNPIVEALGTTPVHDGVVTVDPTLDRPCDAAASELFRLYNADDRPDGKTHRSMSVGDVLEFRGAENDVHLVTLVCASIGWVTVTMANLTECVFWRK